MSALKKTILIVDDSPVIVSRVTELLKEINYVDTIINAGDHDQAVKLMETEKIDIVFLDIQLPGKNGIDILKFIKKNHPGIKTVMLSNQASTYYRNLCSKEGASFFIDKSKEFDLIPGVLAELSV